VRAPANTGPVARSPILHHVSTVVLALGGVLACLEGGNALAFRLPPGVVPVPSANWSTDPGASLTNSNTATGVSQIIKQQANAAVYTWNSFNIANGSSVPAANSARCWVHL